MPDTLIEVVFDRRMSPTLCCFEMYVKSDVAYEVRESPDYEETTECSSK